MVGEPGKAGTSGGGFRAKKIPHSLCGGMGDEASDAQVMVATVGEEDFAGYRRAEVGGQIDGRLAHVFGGDVALERRMFFDVAEDFPEVGNAGSGKGLDGTGADGVDADILGAEVNGKVTHRSFQRGLGHTHDVVVGDDLLGAVVCHGQDGAAGCHQRFKGMTEGSQRIGGDVESHVEAVAGCLDEAMGQIFTIGEGNGVDKDIDTAPLFLHKSCGCGNLLIAGHITGEGEFAAKFFGDGKNPFVDGFSDIAEGESGSLLSEFAGDTIGDAFRIGDPKDEASLVLQ